MIDKLFVKNENNELYEGPLSDKSTELLFVLKEPNGDNLNCFWMRNVVLNRVAGAKYYNVLGGIAKAIIGGTHHSALEHSAYMNLYPFNGKSTVITNEITGKSYSDLISNIEEWKTTTNIENAGIIFEGCANREILINRLQIIKSALEKGVSVAAHFEIVNMLTKYSSLNNHFIQTHEYAENQYHISSYQYKNKAKLYAIPHPASRIKYSVLAKILKLKSIYPENQ